MDRSLPGSSVHGIFQAKVLEWVAIAFSIIIAIRGKLADFWIFIKFLDQYKANISLS